MMRAEVLAAQLAGALIAAVRRFRWQGADSTMRSPEREWAGISRLRVAISRPKVEGPTTRHVAVENVDRPKEFKRERFVLGRRRALRLPIPIFTRACTGQSCRYLAPVQIRQMSVANSRTVAVHTRHMAAQTRRVDISERLGCRTTLDSLLSGMCR